MDDLVPNRASAPVQREYRYRCSRWDWGVTWLWYILALLVLVFSAPGLAPDFSRPGWGVALAFYGIGLVATAIIAIWHARLRRRTRVCIDEDSIEIVNRFGRITRRPLASIPRLKRRLLPSPGIVLRASDGATEELDSGFVDEEEMIGAIASGAGLTYDTRPWQRLLGAEVWSRAPSLQGRPAPGTLVTRLRPGQVAARHRLHSVLLGALLITVAGHILLFPSRDISRVVMFGRPWQVKVRLMLGADPDAPASDQRPLHIAVDDREPGLAQMLLDAGADPNGLWSPADPSPTPLVAAAKKDDASAVRLLLSYGADPTLDPFDMARARQRAGEEVNALLDAAGDGDGT